MIESLRKTVNRWRARAAKVAATGTDKVLIALTAVCTLSGVAIFEWGPGAFVCVLGAYGAGSLRSQAEEVTFVHLRRVYRRQPVAKEAAVTGSDITGLPEDPAALAPDHEPEPCEGD